MKRIHRLEADEFLLGKRLELRRNVVVASAKLGMSLALIGIALTNHAGCGSSGP